MTLLEFFEIINKIAPYVAIVISVLSLLFTYYTYKSGQTTGKLQMLVEISEYLNKARWNLEETLHEMKKLNDNLAAAGFKDGLTKSIGKYSEDLNQMSDAIKTLRKAVDIGLPVDYDKLFILQHYARNSHVSYEAIKERLIPMVRKVSNELDIATASSDRSKK